MSNRSISSDLSHKIMAAVGLLMLASVLGLIEFSGRIITEFTEKNAKSSLSTLSSDVESVLNEVETLSGSVNWLLLDHIDNPDYLNGLNAKMAAESDLVAGAVMAFVPDFYKEKGRYFSAGAFKDKETGEIRFFNDAEYSSADWYTRTVEKGEGWWDEPCVSDEGAGYVVRYSSPMRDGEGAIVAVFSIEVSVPGLTSRLAREHFYDSSYSVLVSRKGIILSHPDSSAVFTNLVAMAESKNDRKFAEFAAKMVAGETGVGEVRSERAAAIYGPLDNGWSVAIICDGREIFGGVIKFQLLLLLFGLLDVIFLYGVTHTIISRALMPITEVTYLAKNVGKGNFKAEVPQVEGHNEMFHLHEALRNMLRSINDYISQLKTTTAANERFESELSIASEIQRQMLRTDFINDEEVDLFATLKPAKEVGGDMYDFLRVDRTIYFAVGDVSGKGVPAALYMAISRSLFHYVSGMSLGTAGVVSCINSSFCSGNDTSMFITMFVGRFDLDTRELVFCNAGHNPIVIISPDGKAKYLHAKSNMAAGVYDEFPYEKESFILEKGTRLLIYTDGVSEAENVDKDQYGEDRLIEFAGSQDTSLTSEEFVNNLLASVKAFTGENDQNDDITIMSVKL